MFTAIQLIPAPCVQFRLDDLQPRFPAVDSYGHVVNRAESNPGKLDQLSQRGLNATDNAAYNARANATNPAYVFAIGLGGQFRRRSSRILSCCSAWRTIPKADTFNGPVHTTPLVRDGGGDVSPMRASYQGNLHLRTHYERNWRRRFLQISSQILRLNK